MPNSKALIQGVIITAVGVFVAGYLMNALRDNTAVKNAINGFDA